MSTKPKQHLFHILMHIGQLLGEETRGRLNEKGLCHGQGRVLSALYRLGEMNQANLARGLGIKPATVTDMLQRMEANGLVERRTDEVTNRAVIVSLTPDGLEAAKAVHATWESIGNRLAASVPAEDMEVVLSALESVRDTLGGTHPEFACRKGAER